MGCGLSHPQLEDTEQKPVHQKTPEHKPSAQQNGVGDMKRRPLRPRDSIYYTDHLFFDADFMPEIHINREGYFDQLKWKRPFELVDHPEMFVSGSEPGDINQGLLGDCWFLSACAAISLHDKLIHRVIPSDQLLKGVNYTGKLMFRFWQYGEWVPVEIDDLLPTVNSKLIFAHSIDEHEFWVPLIEKAYAKLQKSYDALEGGRAMDAFTDLTGGFSERHELNEPDLDVYSKLKTINKNGGVIACSRKGKWQAGEQTVDEFGLVSGHAYTISDVQTVNHQYGKENLIKVRNPWGNEAEWKGAWSDHDSAWSWCTQQDRQRLNVVQQDDGEFWMSFSDFCHHFSEVTTCVPQPDGDVSVIHGAWTADTAGGCRNDMDLFVTNPQYGLDVTCDTECDVTIALMQIPPDRRQLHQIGFIVYEQSGSGRLGYEQLCRQVELGKSGVYINHREVSTRFTLNAGRYVIIPSTFRPGDESKFLIRLLSEHGSVIIKLLTSQQQ